MGGVALQQEFMVCSWWIILSKLVVVTWTVETRKSLVWKSAATRALKSERVWPLVTFLLAPACYSARFDSPDATSHPVYVSIKKICGLVSRDKNSKCNEIVLSHYPRKIFVLFWMCDLVALTRCCKLICYLFNICCFISKFKNWRWSNFELFQIKSNHV